MAKAVADGTEKCLGGWDEKICDFVVGVVRDVRRVVRAHGIAPRGGIAIDGGGRAHAARFGFDWLRGLRSHGALGYESRDEAVRIGAARAI